MHLEAKAIWTEKLHWERLDGGVQEDSEQGIVQCDSLEEGKGIGPAGLEPSWEVGWPQQKGARRPGVLQADEAISGGCVRPCCRSTAALRRLLV